MFVSVRLFAMLRERAGTEAVQVELPEGATVRQAVDAVAHEHGLADLIARLPVVMAVNREYASADSVLAESDELALIPPVSGGAGEAGAEANIEPAVSGGESTFATGAGYERFMELVGNHVLQLPNYVDLLGMRPLAAEPGHVRMEFTASEQFLNPGGVVQGGFITAMLDDTMGPAAVAQLGPGYFAPTLELKVNFLRPVGPGRLVADGRVVHMGRSVAFLEGSLADEEGNVVATATATARIVKLKRPS
jgi:molybdopterin converting factor subunit 1